MGAKKQTIVDLARPVIPLDAAYSMMASITRQIDDGAELDAALVAEFKETRLTEAKAIDQVIVFRGFLDAAEAHAKMTCNEWYARQKQLEAMRATLDNDVIKPVLQSDRERQFRGTIGGLALHKNPPSLVTNWGDRKLDKAIIDMMGIDEEFYEVIPPSTETTYRLKTTEVKAALKEGRELGWAELSHGERVAVTK